MQVDVSGTKISFPHECACCGALPNTHVAVSFSKSHGKKVVHTRTQSWAIPYCGNCTSHVAAYNAAQTAGCGVGIVVILVGLAVGAVFASSARAENAAVITCVAVFVSACAAAVYWSAKKAEAEAKAKSMMTSRCVTVGTAAALVGWHGTLHSFNFVSGDYAFKFMRHNRPKLVNVPANVLLKLAEPAVVRVATAISSNPPVVAAPPTAPNVMTVAPVAPVVADDHQLLKWISKIESQKGPSGRKSALELGCKELRTEEAREKLKLEATRIEVRLTLEKVDSLKQAAAKRRTLTTVIQELREASSDENEIAKLEEALGELG